ncbi:MAG: NADH-quinone oxidoreductase subunit G, partial [Gammaproteobacteria bacterium]
TGSAEQLVADLSAVVLDLSTRKKSTFELSSHLQALVVDCKVSKAHKAIAKSLIDAKDAAIFVGVQAQSNPYLSLIQELCEAIANQSGSTLGYLSPSANSAGACLTGVLPHRGVAGSAVLQPGQNTSQILSAQHQVLLTLAVNPALELNHTAIEQQLDDNNDFIIAIDSFSSEFNRDRADLILPLASFTETSGTFVNVEGLWQSFKGFTQTDGSIRQGWKILTALGQLLVPDAFDYADSISVRNEVKEACRELSLENLCGIQSAVTKLPAKPRSIQKVSVTPIYASDSLVRQALPLQKTPLMETQGAVAMNQKQAEKLNLVDGDKVQIKQGQGAAILSLLIDENIATGCVSVPTGLDAVKDLSSAYGPIELEKVL